MTCATSGSATQGTPFTRLGNALAYPHRNGEFQAAFATFAAHARPGTVLTLATAVTMTPQP
ncbi:MAG: hypothetical protein ACRD0K_17655 [Egibacteraceae bacterium]